MWNDKPDGYPIPARNPTNTGMGMNFYPRVWIRVQISTRSPFVGRRVIALSNPLPSLVVELLQKTSWRCPISWFQSPESRFSIWSMLAVPTLIEKGLAVAALGQHRVRSKMRVGGGGSARSYQKCYPTVKAPAPSEDQWRWRDPGDEQNEFVHRDRPEIKEQEQSSDQRRSFVMRKPRTIRRQRQSAKKIVRREETLISVSVYHIMNITCIHLKVEGPNIYMYRRERIYKEPPGEIQ
jgi:hypothetical protein